MRHRDYLFLCIACIACGICLQSCASSQAPTPGPNELPPGTTISYAAFGSDGFTHVYLLSSNGVVTQLTSGAHTDETPEWSFDATRLVFARRDSTGSAVYVINADGTGLTRLSPTPGADTLPAFSPDGTKVVFTHVVASVLSCGGTKPTTSIQIMSAADGSGRTTLFDGTTAATCFNAEPRFSPDGAKIAFLCLPHNSGAQVCTINPDGSGLTYLTDIPFTVSSDPHWSMDGTKLALSRQDTSGNVNVWTINADGSNLTQVTTFVEPMEGGDAGWSPDDTKLVFEQDDGGQGQSLPNAPANVSIINVNGSGYSSLGVACSDIGCGPRFKPGKGGG